MDGDFKMLFAGFLLGGVIIGIPSSFVSYVTTERDEQEKAIKAGVGYWEQIGSGKQTRFVYGVKPESDN